MRNPFRKAWGLQTDGDLWEPVWIAVLKRGAKNQDLRKVKGHATEQQVQEGQATRADKVGNDKSDDLADDGVRDIGGRGLVKLADWLAKRHDRYTNLMNRIQKMIATITIAEKEERKKKLQVEKIIKGYDTEKWVETDVQIRDEEQNNQDYEKITLPPLIKGKHKFTFCQNMYSEIHTFLQQREWAPINLENQTGGTTWLELFILFDISGNRTDKGKHVKDQGAHARAEKRRKTHKCRHKEREAESGKCRCEAIVGR
jgi:hypothetical protein